MLRLIFRRLAVSVPVLLVVSALVFVLQSLTPGDAARTLLGSGGTQAEYTQLRHHFGLDQPIWRQYLDYLGHAVTGNLGSSFLTGNSVTSLIAQRLPVSLSLILLATLLSSVVGIALGIASAVRGGLLGKALDVVSLAGLALPNFWVGLVLVAFFAVSLHLLPAVGYTTFSNSPTGWAQSLVLPVIALALGGVSAVARTTRDSMLDVLDRDYIRNLRAAGIGPVSLVLKHGLKNAAIPILSVINIVLIGALTGSVFVESVFALPGLGSLVVSSVGQGELAVIQGVALVFTVIVIVVNLAVDLFYGWLNPKVRAR